MALHGWRIEPILKRDNKEGEKGSGPNRSPFLVRTESGQVLQVTNGNGNEVAHRPKASYPSVTLVAVKLSWFGLF